MKKAKRKIIFTLFFVLATLNPSYSNSDDLLSPVSKTNIQNEIKHNSYFNLANIVDEILTKDTSKVTEVKDKKSENRKKFISTSEKFNQGNAKVAYDEYSQLIENVDNDSSLLSLSKIFYEIGYFSLASKATDKIVYKNQYFNNILDLENTYKPNSILSKDEEIYFAKAYADIYFNNNADETITELSTKKNQYQKNDFYNYVLAQAYKNTKQYNLALHTINKAILLNPKNISYQIFKIDTLFDSKKYSEANKQLEKLEKNTSIITFVPEIEIKKEILNAYLAKNNTDRKYHTINKSYLEGNFEKVKKDCLNILNFDKDNDKIISLFAKSELALGQVEKANTNFINAYKLNKNNQEALIGIGDVRYMHGDYKNATKTYKKALRKDKDNYEIIIKLFHAQRQYAKYPKELKKLEAQLEKMPKNQYDAYYKSAISIAQKNPILKEDFLKKTLEINPLYENAIGELIALNIKNKNLEMAKNGIFNLSITLEKNYYFYYLCGLYCESENKTNEAIKYYKTSLNLNPNFEIANTRILKLIPNIIDEEI